MEGLSISLVVYPWVAILEAPVEGNVEFIGVRASRNGH